MAQLSNCPECGRLYVENPMRLCPECQKNELEAEDKVAQYLRGVKKSSIEEIAAATGVKEKIILRMINRGRIVGDFDITYPCEICGAPITEGRVCAKCGKNITDQLQSQVGEKRQEREYGQKESRMYTSINKIRRK